MRSMTRRRSHVARKYGGDDDYEARVRQTLATMSPHKARIMAKKLGITL